MAGLWGACAVEAEEEEEAIADRATGDVSLSIFGGSVDDETRDL